MAEQNIAHLLLAGAFGAIFAASANHYVRRYEAKRDRESQESRLAHVYMTRIAGILAGAEIIKMYTEPYRPGVEAATKKLREQTKVDVDFSHAIAAYIYEAIKEKKHLTPEERKRMTTGVQLLEHHAAELLSFRITPDEQAKLPAKAVVYYSIFAESAHNMRLAIKTICEFIDGKTEVSADQLHAVWLTAVALYQAADRLWTTLKAHGGISDEQANNIMTHFKGTFARHLLGTQSSKESIRAVTEAMRELESADAPKS